MGLVLVSERELNRVEVLSQVVQGRMTVVGAANMLGLSRRQVHRLLKPSSRPVNFRLRNLAEQSVKPLGLAGVLLLAIQAKEQFALTGVVLASFTDMSHLQPAGAKREPQENWEPGSQFQPYSLPSGV